MSVFNKVRKNIVAAADTQNSSLERNSLPVRGAILWWSWCGWVSPCYLWMSASTKTCLRKGPPLTIWITELNFLFAWEAESCIWHSLSDQSKLLILNRLWEVWSSEIGGLSETRVSRDWWIISSGDVVMGLRLIDFQKVGAVTGWFSGTRVFMWTRSI